MLYYLTPMELLARVKDDPTFHQVGVKVSGRIVPGSWERAREGSPHRFRVVDLQDETVSFPVEYADMLPDTFNDHEQVDAVVEGRFREDGVFEATLVLTKCGSRYEERHPRNSPGDDPRGVRSLDRPSGRNLGSGPRIRRRAKTARRPGPQCRA